MTVIERAFGRVRGAKRSSKMIGLVVLLILTAVFLIAYQKDRLSSMLSRGDTVTATFTRQYKLEDYKSVVKLAGVRVGEVTDIGVAAGGGARVSMRLDPGTVDKLGGEPSAAIRPALVVGGVYYIELGPGGRGSVFNGDIPVARTTVPVELDQVLSPINPAAQRGLQGFVRNFDDTLQQGDGQAAIRDFLHDTPPALQPTSVVLTAVRGTEPDQDLTRLVSGMEGFAAVFNRKEGQFGDILDSLDRSTAAFNAAAQPIADTLGTLPETLRTTRAGMDDLQSSLDRLTDTAPKFRDSAQELDPMLKDLGPVVSRARPVVSDLKDALEDAEPALRHLVPVADKGTDMFHDIRGPVLDRVNGPIKAGVLDPWHGSGVYAGGGNDHPMYKELAYLMASFADTWALHDKNTATGRIAATVNGDFFTGGSQFPRTSENQLESAGQRRPLGPQDSDQQHDKGLSGIEQRQPINKDMPDLSGTDPAPDSEANPLLLPMQGGHK
jgi:phospholipid/cholesterol/gamma-HCH transport system substrate-binding protein